MSTLIQTRASNAIHRDGHKPFTSTIADRLSQAARERIDVAFTRNELESMRAKRKGGKS